MKRIVYLDGGKLIVCTPVINTNPVPEQITEDEAVTRALLSVPATATDIRILPESAIPATRTYREAWVYNAGKTAVIEDPAQVATALAAANTAAALEAEVGADGILEQVAALDQTAYNLFFNQQVPAGDLPALRLAFKRLLRATARLSRRVS